MWKTGQAETHLVYLALHRFTNREWQRIKRLAECRRPDLKRGRHKSLRLACRVIARSDVSARLIKLGLDLGRQLEPIFEIVVDPLADLLDLSAGQFRDRRLNLFYGAHGFYFTTAVCSANHHVFIGDAIRGLESATKIERDKAI